MLPADIRMQEPERLHAPAPPAGPPPSVFSIVMATGIVGIAALQQGQRVIATALIELAAVALSLCCLLMARRALRDPGAMRADFRNHARAPGWFTCVAGTAVVGSGSVALGVHGALPSVLLALAAAAWLVLTYAVFAGLATAREKPALAHGIDGAWLLAVVATQSLAVLAALLSPGAAQPARLDLNFMALCGWLVGGMLYTWLMTLIVYRALFFRFEPSDLTPPWWINMGAMAISTLAGAQLVVAAPDAPMLQSMLPFLRGGTVLFWATGTWWLPLLVVLSVWRHVLRREPLRYALAQWSAVFPLGMYSVATGKLGLALDLPFAATVSTVFFWIALAAWLAAAVGWLRATVRRYAHRAA